ncbi:NAD-dependent epimerase/dehydratase family protein [Segetibacter koreensis]|uniref:NAD-dependent epimerase/dehydratase family protein n=1 Tax=Segetibacter koreensis TaxID=398037 RepID=UPI00037F6713|nr:NAD-dependent epimerase/dehydratase family protein [Segetibacter koreensis]
MSESEKYQYKNPGSSNTPGVKDSGCVFVTGATGLVGSHLIDELTTKGKSVKALYRSQMPGIRNKDTVEWIKGDILDIVFLEEALQNVHQVYHCAGIVSYDPRQKPQMFATNVEGTANVVNASIYAGVKKLCFVSSVAALGQKRKGEEIDETMGWSEETHNSNYGRSKYLAEMEVWRGIGEGLNAVIVNPAIILGAGDWNEGSTKIFKTAFEEFPWYSQGKTGFVDVNDVVRIMVQLMESNIGAERFIISAENRKYRDIFTAIANAFGKAPPYKKVTPFIASLIWRLEVLKSMFTNEGSLLTKETAQSAQAVVSYNNNKLRNNLPFFEYTPLEETIKRVCKELQEKNFPQTVSG